VLEQVLCGVFVELVKVSVLLTPPVLRALNVCSNYVMLLLRVRDIPGPGQKPCPLAGKLLFLVLYDGQAHMARLMHVGDTLFVFRPYFGTNVGEPLFDPTDPSPAAEAGTDNGAGPAGSGMRHIVRREREAVSPFVVDCGEEYEGQRFMDMHLEYGSGTILFRILNAGSSSSSSSGDLGGDGSRKRKLQLEASPPPATAASQTGAREAVFAAMRAKYDLPAPPAGDMTPRYLDMTGASRLVSHADLCCGMTSVVLVLRVLAVVPIVPEPPRDSLAPPCTATQFHVFGQSFDPPGLDPATATATTAATGSVAGTETGAVPLVRVSLPLELLQRTGQSGSDCDWAMEAGNIVALSYVRVLTPFTVGGGDAYPGAQALPPAVARLLSPGAADGRFMVHDCVVRSSSALGGGTDGALEAGASGSVGPVNGSVASAAVLNFSHAAALATSSSMVDQLTRRLYLPGLGTPNPDREGMGGCFVVAADVVAVNVAAFGSRVSLLGPMEDQRRVLEQPQPQAQAHVGGMAAHNPRWRRHYIIIRPVQTPLATEGGSPPAPRRLYEGALLCYYQERCSNADNQGRIVEAGAVQPRRCYTQFVTADKPAVRLRSKFIVSRVDDLCDGEIRLSPGCGDCGMLTGGGDGWPGKCRCGAVCAIQEWDFRQLYRIDVVGQPLEQPL